MFGFCIVRKRSLEELESAFLTRQRVYLAYRWLSEFDPLLEPLWAFLLDESTTDIPSVRDEMRKRRKLSL